MNEASSSSINKCILGYLKPEEAISSLTQFAIDKQSFHRYYFNTKEEAKKIISQYNYLLNADVPDSGSFIVGHPPLGYFLFGHGSGLV